MSLSVIMLKPDDNTADVKLSGDCKYAIAPNGIFLTSLYHSIDTPLKEDLRVGGPAYPSPIHITKKADSATLSMVYATLSRAVYPTLIFARTVTLKGNPKILEKITLTNAIFVQVGLQSSGGNTSGIGEDQTNETYLLTYEYIDTELWKVNGKKDDVITCGDTVSMQVAGGVRGAVR